MHSHSKGLTIVELMIGLAIAAIMMAFAIPAFNDFRERTLVRGMAEEFVALVGNARFESVQRDRPVTVTFTETATAGVWCAGAREGNDAACNCLQADAAQADFCPLGTYPPLDAGSTLTAAQQVIRTYGGVRLYEAPDFGGRPRFTFDPKLGLLTDPARAGRFGLQSPTVDLQYRLRVQINPLGRPSTCAVAHKVTLVGYPPC